MNEYTNDKDGKDKETKEAEVVDTALRPKEEEKSTELSKTELDKLSERLKKFEETIEIYESNKRKSVKDARNFLSGDEFNLADTSTMEGVQIQLRAAKKIVDTMISSVTQNAFEISVAADSLPYFPPDHPFSQVKEQFAQLFAVKNEEEGVIVSELLTHALETFRDILDIEERIEQLIELALVDGTAYLKDGYDGTEQDKLTLDVVQWTDLAHDLDAYTFDEVSLIRHSVQMKAEEIEERWPEVEIDKLKVDDKRIVASGQKNEDASTYTIREYWIKNKDHKWDKAYVCKEDILEFVEQPFIHGHHPFHQLTGITNVKGADGLSLVRDIIYDLAIALNKITSATVANVELTSNNKQLINQDAVENPEALTDNSISNIQLKPGRTFAEAVMQLPGQSISPAFGALQQMLEHKLNDITGMNQIHQPGAPRGSSDVVMAGMGQVGLLRRRVKRTVKSACFNILYNLVTLCEEERSFRYMGGVGPTYIKFNPFIFSEFVENFEARFSIVVSDEDQYPSDPKEIAELQNEAMKTASESTQMTGLPLSITLRPAKFPGKTTLLREIRRKEIEAEIAQQQAAERGDPSPDQLEVIEQRNKEKASARFEVTKKIQQKLAEQDPLTMSMLENTGITSIMFDGDDVDPQELQQGLMMIEQLLMQVGDNPVLQSFRLSFTLRLQQIQAQIQQAQMEAIAMQQQQAEQQMMQEQVPQEQMIEEDEPIE